MDYESYRQKYFAKPAPDPRFEFRGLYGTTLYFSDYEDAVDFYTRVLGDPAYVEGQGTRGWQLGNTWLTLLKGKSGNPKNLELNTSCGPPKKLTACRLLLSRLVELVSRQLINSCMSRFVSVQCEILLAPIY